MRAQVLLCLSCAQKRLIVVLPFVGLSARALQLLRLDTHRVVLLGEQVFELIQASELLGKRNTSVLQQVQVRSSCTSSRDECVDNALDRIDCTYS